jgi:hypothetical protein
VLAATLLSLGLATALTFLVERPALNAIRDWYRKNPLDPFSRQSR